MLNSIRARATHISVLGVLRPLYPAPPGRDRAPRGAALLPSLLALSPNSARTGCLVNWTNDPWPRADGQVVGGRTGAARPRTSSRTMWPS